MACKCEQRSMLNMQIQTNKGEWEKLTRIQSPCGSRIRVSPSRKEEKEHATEPIHIKCPLCDERKV